MKELTLIRHAKSSWKDVDLKDHERPLSKRGERDAPVMGKRLAKRGYKPDLVVSSPAVRALKTARIIAKELGYKRKNIVVAERLYGSSTAGLLSMIRSLDQALKRVMVVGHNPELTDLANRLGGGRVHNLPTCGVARLRFDTDSWAEIENGGGVDVDLDYPKVGVRD